jgi:parallel beta-helix repeat protein
MRVHSNYGYGFHIYDSGSNSVSNNVVRDSLIYSNAGPEGGIGLLLSCGSNNEAYGNKIYDNEGGIQVDYGCTDCLIYNNTVYNNSSIGQGIRIGSTVVRAIVKNNIVYANQINGILDTGINSDISYNHCDSSGTGCSIVGDPLFADPVSHDFSLLAGSPAKGAGTPYIDANTSFSFVPDIGAIFDL